MSTHLLPDVLWNLIQPMLPSPPRRPKGGRPRLPDRVCLTGILFVVRSGIPWEMLPQELDCGSGMTCWRRLRDWQEAGIWQLMHFVVAGLAGTLLLLRSATPNMAAGWADGAGLVERTFRL